MDSKEIANLLFEISQKLLSIQSLCRANPILDNLPELSGIKPLQEEAHEVYTEIMKNHHD